MLTINFQDFSMKGFSSCTQMVKTMSFSRKSKLLIKGRRIIDKRCFDMQTHSGQHGTEGDFEVN